MEITKSIEILALRSQQQIREEQDSRKCNCEKNSSGLLGKKSPQYPPSLPPHHSAPTPTSHAHRGWMGLQRKGLRRHSSVFGHELLAKGSNHWLWDLFGLSCALKLGKTKTRVFPQGPATLSSRGAFPATGPSRTWRKKELCLSSCSQTKALLTGHFLWNSCRPPPIPVLPSQGQNSKSLAISSLFLFFN